MAKRRHRNAAVERQIVQLRRGKQIEKWRRHPQPLLRPYDSPEAYLSLIWNNAVFDSYALRDYDDIAHLMGFILPSVPESSSQEVSPGVWQHTYRA